MDMHDRDHPVVANDELLWEQRIEALVERKVSERFDRLQAVIAQALAQVQVRAKVIDTPITEIAP